MEGKNTGRSIVCPFCGAPYRNIVPSDAAQVKCEYCSATFSVLSHFKGAARCPNHPEVFGIGLCNDCGGYFCARCLQVYDLRTDNGVRLYLCPECLRNRKLERANASIYAGIVFVAVFSFIGLLFSSTKFSMAGILAIPMILCGVLVIVYGIWKRGSTISEAETKIKEEKDEEELAKEIEVAKIARHVDADMLYGKMLFKYMMKCSLVNAKELLDNEIRAYVRSGQSYEEAVYKVAKAKGLIKDETKRTK